MKSHSRLFDRLAGESLHVRGVTGEALLMASVATHLGLMLSTRQGSVETLPDYGLPDLNDMRLSLHEALSQARSVIELFIRTYEPRLSNVQLVAIPQDPEMLTLSFVIEGSLVVAGRHKKVSFSANLKGTGQVQVQQN